MAEGKKEEAPAAAATERFTFKYVFMPSDNTEPIQELELETPRGGDAEVTSLLDALKRHFRATGPRKTDAQKAAQKAALLQRLTQQQQEQGGASTTTTTPSTQVQDLLDRVVDGDILGGGMVENIALLSNAPETGFVGVNLYCDDEAAIKKLPRNARASSLAMQCGKPLDVLGDAFLARVFDNEEEFKRMDLTLSELSNDKGGFVREAAAQAERRRERERSGASAGGGGGSGDPSSFLAGLRGMAGKGRAGKVAEADKKQQLQEKPKQHPSDAERDRGNGRFKQGDYEGAAGHYTAALKLAEVVAGDGSGGGAGSSSGASADESERRRLRLAALGNRAMAFLKMERWADCAADASRVIDEQEEEEGSSPAVIKARLRRAAALKEMGDVPGAKADLEHVLGVEPANKEAAEALAALS